MSWPGPVGLAALDPPYGRIFLTALKGFLMVGRGDAKSGERSTHRENFLTAVAVAVMRAKKRGQKAARAGAGSVGFDRRWNTRVRHADRRHRLPAERIKFFFRAELFSFVSNGVYSEGMLPQRRWW